MLNLVAILVLAVAAARTQEPPPLVATAHANRAELAPGGTLKLALELQIAPGWHVSAHEVGETQIATDWTLAAPAGFTVDQVIFPSGREQMFVGEKIRAYQGEQWLGARVLVDGKVTPGTYEIKSKLAYQACNERGQCLMPATRDVSFAITVAAAPKTGEREPEVFARIPFRPDFTRGEKIRYRAWSEPAGLERGAAGDLAIEVAVDPGWHTYGLKSKGGYATRLSLGDVPGIEAAGEPTEPKPVEFENEVLKETELRHEGTVIFRLPFRVKADAKPGPVTLKAELTYEVCDLARCLPPTKIAVQATLAIADRAGAR